MEEVSTGDSPVLVLLIYALVVLPLGLYLYHDVLDTRWRRVQNLRLYLVLYATVGFLSTIGMIAYLVYQGFGRDYKEIGASCVALLIASYGFLKLARLNRILQAHKYLLETPVSECDKVLRQLSPGDRKIRNFMIDYRDRPFVHRISLKSDRTESRGHCLSSVLFDDDYPGTDAARIRWLNPSGFIKVNDEDAEEAATRTALFMRFALRSARKELWTIICATHPLVTNIPERVSVGKMLHRLLVGGSALETPSHVQLNPVELMLNKKATMSQLGVSWFWVAARESPAEVAQALSHFPQRWLRNARQSGFEFIFETSIFSILSDYKDTLPTRPTFDDALTLYRFSREGRADSVPPDSNQFFKTLSNLRENLDFDARIDVSETDHDRTEVENPVDSFQAEDTDVAARKCADALMAMLAGNTEFGLSFFDTSTLETSMFWAISKTFAHVSRSQNESSEIFKMAIEELLRISQLASTVSEAVLGPLFADQIHVRWGRDASLKNAEVCWGLAAIVEHLGWTKGHRSRQLLEMWGMAWGGLPVMDDDTMFSMVKKKIERADDPLKISVINGPLWMIRRDIERCPDPDEAFLAFVELSRFLAEGVLYAFWDCATKIEFSPIRDDVDDPSNAQQMVTEPNDLHLLDLPAKFGPAAMLHANWVKWKRDVQGVGVSVRSAYVL